MTDFEYCKNTEYIQDISWHKQKKLHGYPVTYQPDSPPRVFSTFCASGIIRIRAYIGFQPNKLCIFRILSNLSIISQTSFPFPKLALLYCNLARLLPYKHPQSFYNAFLQISNTAVLMQTFWTKHVKCVINAWGIFVAILNKVIATSPLENYHQFPKFN